jgi:hypothetical protein
VVAIRQADPASDSAAAVVASLAVDSPVEDAAASEDAAATEVQALVI